MKNKLSFRDPDGFVFEDHGRIFRVINSSFARDYHWMIQNGIFQNPLLLPFTDVTLSFKPDEVFKIIEPQRIPVITYPWEWTPGMLLEAALSTLDLALDLNSKNVILKDASFFNIQFVNGRVVLIDHLSLKHTENKYPWIAYGQFLRHFIYPLTLIKYGRITDLNILQNYNDGLPSKQVISLLPLKSKFNFFELFNIHLIGRIKSDLEPRRAHSLNNHTQALNNLIQFSKDYLLSLKSKHISIGYQWKSYYQNDVDFNYHTLKMKSVTKICEELPHLQSATDIGANTGEYSELFCKYASTVISLEADVNCCDIIFSKIKKTTLHRTAWTVVCADITEPSPALGWMNKERQSLLERIKSRLISALAVMHHIIIAKRIPLDEVINLLAYITEEYLLIEYIDPDDEKVVLLRKSHYQSPLYGWKEFEASINRHFTTIKEVRLTETRRLLLLVRKR